jgi:SAM-dependent methyltransferase
VSSKNLFNAWWTRTKLQLLHLKWGLQAAKYRGNKRYCNCCNQSFSQFITYGRNPRPEAACPACMSLERTRLLLHFLQHQYFPIQKPTNILHVAPEYCLEKTLRNHFGASYMSVDLAPGFADKVEDLQALSFPDASFDLIICSHVLGHIPDEHKAITEMHRVLRKQGVCIVLTVRSGKDEAYEDLHINSADQRLLHYGEPDLLRLHGNDMKQRLSKGGFNVIELDYGNTLSAEWQEKLSIGNGLRERLYLCSK